MKIKYYLKAGLLSALLTATLILNAAWQAPRCDNTIVLDAIARATPAAYPDADIVIVADVESIRYNPDGTAEKSEDCYEKILTRKGKEERKSIVLHYTLPYNTANMEKLEIIRNGKTIPVDIAKQSRLQVEAAQMSKNIYNPNSKIITVQIPDLQPGDTLHYITNHQETKPYIPNTVSGYYNFQSTAPILDYRLIVDAPASTPLRSIALKDEIKGTITTTQKQLADRIIYEWHARNVPRFFEEPGMPPSFTVTQRLLFSTTPAWKDISQWYWKLCQPHLEKTTPAMIAKVKELTAGLTSDEDKIKAIFRFVAYQIRYMGITTETEAPGYEPHDVNITFDNKYGVCRDKAALLITMLRLADFNARPVLFYVGPKKDAEVPNNYFNHAIVAIEKKTGDYILMDPTDENSRDLFPSYLCNKSYLVARPDGDLLRTSAVVPAENNLLDITTTGELALNGTLKANSMLKFNGINDGSYRDTFLKWKEEKRSEFFISRLRHVLPGVTVRKVEIIPAKLDDMTIPLEVRLTYEVPNFLLQGNKANMLRLPWLGTQFGLSNFVLAGTGLETRRFPMQITAACGVNEHFELKLNGYSQPLLLPQYVPVDQPDFQWQQQVTWNHNTLTGNARFAIRTLEISPNSYTALKKQLAQIEYDRRKMPLFAAENLNRNADTLLMQKDTSLIIQNEHSWIKREHITRKVLTYAGKKSSSELKFSYNPIWTDCELGHAAVTSPDGKTQLVKPQEVNLMDAEGAGNAPRYPAGKIKVVSLPNVEPGSIIDYEVTYAYRSRPFFTASEVFRGFEPRQKQSFSLTIPQALKDKIRLSPTPAGITLTQKKTADNQIIYSWQVAAVAPIKEEQNPAPLFLFNPTVLASSGNWHDYTTALNQQLTAAAEAQTQTIAKANELAATVGNNPEARLRATNDYILQNIHLAGPEFNNLPLTCLSPADLTLKDSYGNTADRAVVFYAMLKTMGFKPEFILAGSEPPIDELYRPFYNLPFPGLFSTVLVRIPHNGEMLYLNHDNAYGIPGICYSDSKPGLELSSGKIIRINNSETRQNRTRSVMNIDFDVNGNAVITRKITYYGEAYSSFRKSYNEMTPEKRRRYFLEEASTVSQTAKIISATADITGYPAVKTLQLQVPHYAVRDGRYLYFTLPGAGVAKLLPSGTEKRTTPYLFNQQVNATYVFNATVAGNPANVLMQPESWKWTTIDESDAIEFQFAQSNTNSFGAELKINLCPAIVPSYRFNEYLWAGDKLAAPSLWQVTLELPPQ